MLYRAKIGHTSTGTSIYEDKANTTTAAWTDRWQRIDEGYYQMIDPDPETDPDKKLTTTALAQKVCTDAKGTSSTATVYSSDNLCITVDSVNDTQRVLAFAATGNMLNWLMSSKFDIQKAILTGGKYKSEDNRLVSENRGCSGSRFIKEVPITDANKVAYKLTMAVRGPEAEGDPLLDDRIDSTDDTSRVEILAVNTSGYNAEACQIVIEDYMEDGSLQGDQDIVQDCLEALPGATVLKERDVLNHAMQTCWQNAEDLSNAVAYTDYLSHLQTNIKDCMDVYATMPSGDISSSALTYNCYGVYDPTRFHSERVGYIGRCWEAGSTASSTCDYKEVETDFDNVAPKGCNTSACPFWYSYITDTTTDPDTSCRVSTQKLH